MADITMCANKICSKRNICYRQTAEPDMMQSQAEFEENGPDECFVPDFILNLCPFCGHHEQVICYDADGNRFFIMCENCHACGPSAGEEQDAIKYWNGDL